MGKITLLENCKGKRKCDVFSSPEELLKNLGEPVTFENMMQAMLAIKSWRCKKSCPMAVQAPKKPVDKNDRPFHKPICSAKAKAPDYSMESLRRGTGYSKTRVAQIEYDAIRKMRRRLASSAGAFLATEYGIDVDGPVNVSKSRL